jgi:hypothetical protein
MLQSSYRLRAISVLLLIALFVSTTLVSQAAEPVTWTTNSRADLLRGDARGVSITDVGAITLAPKLDQLFATEQAYIWSTAIDSAGNVYLGTGHDGKIFKVGPDGRGALLYDAPELDVTALAVAPDGSLYAGTSPDGKVYRIGADGKAEVYFDPPDKYIWSLAVTGDGSLGVGTGDSGKLYRVRAKDAKPETSVLSSTAQTHVISLAADSRGNFIAGTEPGGLVLRISPEGKTFGLFDSPLREIHAIAPAPDGSVYVLGLSDAAAKANPTVGGTTSGEASGGGTATVTITSIDESGATASQAAQPAKSKEDLTNARSAVVRILPDGGTDVLWNSSSVTAFSICVNPLGNGVLVGTSDKGRIYSVTNAGRDTLLLQTPEAQVSVLTSRGHDVFASSSNQGKLFKFGTGPVAEGSYESPVRDGKLVSSWGRIWWRGQGKVELQTRSGNSEGPDTTWSDWSAPYTNSKGTQIASPRARFIQWRAVLHAAGPDNSSGNPVMESVSLAYLPRNVAPEVVSITFFPTGVGLQPALQVQADPNIEASGLDPSLFGVQVQLPPRKVYQRGGKSFQWLAEDRNGDTLEYSIFYRGLDETGFRLLKDKIRDNFYTIDSSALADGKYIFKVVASDAPDNPAGQALTSERISEPIEIDNDPPNIKQVGETQITGDRVKMLFEAVDSIGTIKRAEVSVDGGPWRAVFPEDGIADSPMERYLLDLPVTSAGEHTVSLRVFDSSGNPSSTRVVVKK